MKYTYAIVVGLITLSTPVIAAEKCEPRLMPAESLTRLMQDLVTEDVALYNELDSTALDPRHTYVCYAQDRFRRRYAAKGPTPQAAQNHARHACEKATGWACYELGCRADSGRGRRGD